MVNRILVVSEFFSSGGLETQIEGQIRVLSGHSVNFYLATSTPLAQVPNVGFSAILSNLCFGANATYEQVANTLDQIVAFGKDCQVDLVHCHPFYSLPIGALVADALKIPFVATIHAPANLIPYSTHMLEFSHFGFALHQAQRLFCVSHEVQLYLEAIFGLSSTVLPNAVSTSISVEDSQVSNPHNWMWAGRLDEDKLYGLLDLIDKTSDLPITLHIYGDGAASEHLETRLATPSVANVELMGWRSDLVVRMCDYGVVAGMGRVILEAAAINAIPVLVGYDGVKGVVDETTLSTAVFANLSGRGMKTISTRELSASVNQAIKRTTPYSLRDWARQNRREEDVWLDYMSQVDDLRYGGPFDAVQLMQLLSKKSDHRTQAWSDEVFYDIATSRLYEAYVKGYHSGEANTEKSKDVGRRAHPRITPTPLNMTGILIREQNLIIAKKQLQNENQRLGAELKTTRDSVNLLERQVQYAENVGAYWEQRFSAIANSTFYRYSAPVRVAGRVTSLTLTAPHLTFARLRRFTRLARAEGWMHTSKSLLSRLSDPGTSTPVETSLYFMSLGLAKRVTLSTVLLAVENARQLGSPVWVQYYNCHWNIELFQRPQQILLAMSRLNTICVYLTDEISENTYLQVGANVFLINDHAFVVKLRGCFVSVYSTALNVSQSAITEFSECNIVLYEYIDEIDEAISGQESVVKLIEQQHFFFEGAADVIIASAKTLFEEARARVGHSRVHYVPNGVDYEHYKVALEQITSVPSDVPQRTDKHSAVVGYFGALAPWLWYDMINEVTAVRMDLAFVFVGPDYNDAAAQIESRDNVLVKGPVAYDVLPEYAKVFDVAIIPFRPGKIAQTTSPLKLFEYFALEKPVVVTSDMRECTMYPDVFSGGDVAEFSTALDEALKAGKSEEYRKRVRSIAKENRWERRAMELVRICQESSRHGD